MFTINSMCIKGLGLVARSAGLANAGGRNIVNSFSNAKARFSGFNMSTGYSRFSSSDKLFQAYKHKQPQDYQYKWTNHFSNTNQNQ